MDKNRVFVSHPTGNTFSRQLLIMLQEFEMLTHFVTGLRWQKGCFAEKLLSRGLVTQLRRRSFDLPKEKITARSHKEVLRLFSERFRVEWLRDRFSVDCIYRETDELAAKLLDKYPASTVYAYEDGAYETFKKAKALNIRCCYDLPIAHWRTLREIMGEEALRLPEWAQTIQGVNDSTEKLQRKDEELDMADLVVVPSQFVYDSLPEATKAAKPCEIVPFGTYTNNNYTGRLTPESGPLRILFAGAMTQRKGLADLFEAIKMLKVRRSSLL